MNRSQGDTALGWLLALSMLLAILVATLTGCEQLRRATPVLLAAAEQILVQELTGESDAMRADEIRQALDLLEECRRARAAAEDAARRATEAAVLAQEGAELDAREREAKELARESAAKLELRRTLVRLRIRVPDVGAP